MTDNQSPQDSANLLPDRLNLDAALEAAGLGRWAIDLQAQLLIYDDRCQTLMGFQQRGKLLLGESINQIHSEDRQRVQTAFQRAMTFDSNGSFDQTFRIGEDASPLRWVRCWGQCYFTPQGKADRLVGVAQDVTLQVQKDQQLMEEKKHLHEQVAQLQQLTDQQAQSLARSQQAILAQQAGLTLIFDQFPVGIALLEGPDYRIKLANKSIYDLWQLPPGSASVINQPVFEAFPGIANLGLEELLVEVRRSGTSIYGLEQTAVFLRQSGPETAYINFVYAPIYDIHGQIDIAVVAIEVTEQVQARQKAEASENQYRLLTQELKATNQQLLRSNDNLQQFAYVASHDLQEPLRKIQTFSDLLMGQFEDQINELSRDYLQRINKAAIRMAKLITDLLAYSRLSTRQTVVESINLNSILADVLATLEWTISQQKADIQISTLPVVPGDATQLGQLFQNLLANALKFTQPRKPPQVRIESQARSRKELLPDIRPASEAEMFYQIRVEDKGIGFDPQYADRIFQVFQRLHGKNDFAGTGVGLAICQRVVENHGGAIRASGVPGEGATFWVYLPA